ncbi:phosphoglycerate dehydrogenase [Nakamurella lactea]|uniref:phosphoglycerate dehydrogenase n=1 Tax=Nakamurella lactea TaxID=459515 RepID=UPI000426A415|nr:phosphoglycerate dehydrogenase [Nakamurella lactea]
MTTVRDAPREVLVTWPDFPDDGSPEVARLKAAGLELRRSPRTRDRTVEEMIELVSGCVAGIVSTDRFSREVLAAAPTLRILSRVGVGTDSIDLAAAADLGIAVTSAKGTNEEAVADHTVAMILAACRKVAQHDRAVRAGRWDRTGDWVGRDLHKASVGLIGLGTIARAVARRLEGFGASVFGTDPLVAELPGVTVVPLDQLLASCDIVSLHLPLTPQTWHMFDATLMKAMRPGSILVNTARGGIVDERALETALRSGHLAMAALDVFTTEPPARSGLLDLVDRTVLTAHVGGLTRDSVRSMVWHATEAVAAALTGTKPADLVNRPRAPVWAQPIVVTPAPETTQGNGVMP